MKFIYKVANIIVMPEKQDGQNQSRQYSKWNPLRWLDRKPPAPELTPVNNESVVLEVVGTPEERAKAKIVDLRTDQEHLIHFTDISILPIILQEGLRSHDDLSHVTLDSPSYRHGAVTQRNLEIQGKRGMELVSVYDPLKKGSELTNSYAVLSPSSSPHFDQNPHRGPVALLISRPKAIQQGILEHHDAYDSAQNEAYLRGGCKPTLFEGVVLHDEWERPYMQTIMSMRNGREIAFDLLQGSQFEVIRDYNEDNRRRFLSQSLNDSELDELRTRFNQLEPSVNELYIRLARSFGFDGMKNFNDFLPIEFSPGGRFSDRGPARIDISRHGPVKERKNLDAIRRKRQESITAGKEMALDDLAAQLTFFGMDGSKVKARSSVDEILNIMEKIVDGAQEMSNINNTLWIRYLEKLTGKGIDDVSLKDLLIGLCQQSAIPLYGTDGKVLWPEE